MSAVSALFSKSFSPLKNRDYRIYIIGQAISLIGTFMQQVAQQWYVWDITKDSRWIGVIGACAFVPLFLLSPITGSIADRVDRRKLLIATQVTEMTLAFILGALALSGVREVWPIVILALLLGVSAAFTFPTQSAFIGDDADNRRWTASAPMSDLVGGDIQAFGAAHGVCHFAFGDGATKGLAYTIDPAVFRSLGHRFDRSPTSPPQ